MQFANPLIPAIIHRRYKRFLADVELADGTLVTAHCPNSGAMTGCWAPGWEVRLSHSDNPKRKLAYTLEMVHNGACWIGVNTMNPNRVVLEGLRLGHIPELAGYAAYRSEVKYGKNSRIDVLAEGLAADAGARCYIEVKNTTLVGDDGACRFPDAVSERGRKHLHELMDMVKEGHRAVMVYFVGRADGTIFRPAIAVDPAYAAALVSAHAAGVEVLPYRAVISPDGIHLAERLPFELA